jgi:sulfoxide reductase heme-binding subunit YedZ
MAITSSKWAMREMGKWWKRLHRLVYAAGVILVAHIVLESTNKKVAVTDWQFGAEAWLYAAILAVLLAARVPAVRSALAGLRHQGEARQGVQALTE